MGKGTPVWSVAVQDEAVVDSGIHMPPETAYGGTFEALRYEWTAFNKIDINHPYLFSH